MTDLDRPPFSGHFVFTVDGVEIGAFTEVSGLAAEIEVEEVVEGGQNQYTHKLPGRMTWPPIVLKSGVTSSDRLFQWFTRSSGDGFAAEGDKLTRNEGAVVLVDAAGEPVRTWEFVDAFPVKWSGPTLAASATDVAVEELEIAHHGFRSS
jgi:phage tail-like protein